MRSALAVFAILCLWKLPLVPGQDGLPLARASSGEALDQIGGFDDVPPWHWAAEAVQKATAAGIIIGHPSTDRDAAINAVMQVYEAFANASHPAARTWAERFLANLPGNWPDPLQRSRVTSSRLSDSSVTVRGNRQVVKFAAAVTMRSHSGVTEARALMRIETQKDRDGHVRVNYATLAAQMPQVFR